MKTLIIKSLWTGILTLTVVGAISSLDGTKAISKNSAENKGDIVTLQANRSPASEGKTIVFTYNHKGKPLKLSFQGVSWEVALKEGAHKCIDYYTDGKRAKVEEELYLDLIDVCVNPR